jgi:CRP-like cAMP-binding protein
LCRQFSKRLKEANAVIESYQEKAFMKLEQRYMKANEVVFKAGEVATVLYQIVDGQVVPGEGDAAETLSERKLPSGFINARAFLTGGVNDADVVAKGGAILIAYDRETRLAIIRNCPELLDVVLEEA